MNYIKKLKIKTAATLCAAAATMAMGSLTSCVDEINVGNGFLDKQPGVDVTMDTIFVKGESAKRFLWHMYGAMHNPFTYTGAVWYSHPDALTDICQSYCGWHNLGKYYGGPHRDRPGQRRFRQVPLHSQRRRQCPCRHLAHDS
jgi:hypothetical protein